MAEEQEDQQQQQEKTEQPTPKRREEARKKGQVAKSQEVASVTIMLACLVLFYFTIAASIDQVSRIMRWFLMEAGRFEMTAEATRTLFVRTLGRMGTLLFPLFLTVFVAGLGANLIQVGFLFAPETIRPKLSKISPIRGFKQKVSLRSLVELAKSLFKIVVVTFVVYLTIRAELVNIIPVGWLGPWGILDYTWSVSFKIIFRVCWALVILAMLDYLYQRWEYEKNLRMTRKEIKDEMKNTEGDPLVKARIRKLQREAARQRMMASVEKADVVVTNPTHIAVALRYDPDTMAAPMVTAKGRGYTAQKIKEIAAEHNVPIVENKLLAQLLNKMVKVNEMIPAELYRAVAEVLAYVYRRGGERARKWNRS